MKLWMIEFNGGLCYTGDNAAKARAYIRSRWGSRVPKSVEIRGVTLLPEHITEFVLEGCVPAAIGRGDKVTL